jgi:hypothetical protein
VLEALIAERAGARDGRDAGGRLIHTGRHGKVVVVTGANHGIGAATARIFGR